MTNTFNTCSLAQHFRILSVWHISLVFVFYGIFNLFFPKPRELIKKEKKKIRIRTSGKLIKNIFIPHRHERGENFCWRPAACLNWFWAKTWKWNLFWKIYCVVYMCVCVCVCGKRGKRKKRNQKKWKQFPSVSASVCLSLLTLVLSANTFSHLIFLFLVFPRSFYVFVYFCHLFKYLLKYVNLCQGLAAICCHLTAKLIVHFLDVINWAQVWQD